MAPPRHWLLAEGGSPWPVRRASWGWGQGGTAMCCVGPAAPGVPLALPWVRDKVWERVGGDAAIPWGMLCPCPPALIPYDLSKHPYGYAYPWLTTSKLVDGEHGRFVRGK